MADIQKLKELIADWESTSDDIPFGLDEDDRVILEAMKFAADNHDILDRLEAVEANIQNLNRQMWQLEKTGLEHKERAEAAEALNNHLDLAVRKAEGASEALRRRAEAAEAQLAAARGVKKIWQDRAWTAEEKLAELAKQEVPSRSRENFIALCNQFWNWTEFDDINAGEEDPRLEWDGSAFTHRVTQALWRMYQAAPSAPPAPFVVKLPHLPDDCDRTEAHYKYAEAIQAAGGSVENDK